MRVLVTGHDGYIGRVLVPMFTGAGHEVVGLDSGLYVGCALDPDDETTSGAVTSVQGDVRDVTEADLQGIDAVVHLAAISNDPVGDLHPDCTLDINHRGTVHLAEVAKRAGVPRFLFSSSCSLYGAAGDEVLDERAAFNPVTPYGRSKILAERDLSALADDEFSPTYLRNATAYGVSPRLRGDLVVNNLTGYAVTIGEVLLRSDGTPWRPLVHIEDISAAFLALAEAERDLVHDQAFNVGRSDENYRISTVAEIVEERVPGSRITMADSAGPDLRNYRIDCSKIEALEGYRPRWTVAAGVEQLRAAYTAAGLTREVLEGPRLSRIAHVRGLLDAGVIDDALRWRDPAGIVADDGR
jgi:nucleoside-diphosphate-sugar epimerase